MTTRSCDNCTNECSQCPNDRAAIWLPADRVNDYDPRMIEIIWNSDYTAFRAVRLPWYDEASYLAYQGDRGDRDDESV